jgi:arylsulfatase A-like enzyme
MLAGRRRPVALLSLATALLGTLGCAPRAVEPHGPRLVVLFATCTLSRHHISPYNAQVTYTPNLSAFAAEGTVFERHQTESGQSGLAFASILSGTQADRHGVYRHPYWLRDEAFLVAEAFAERGYETHFWNGHPMAAADLNYGQGVPSERVHTSRHPEPDKARLTANDQEFAAILQRLQEEPDYRAFVQVLFSVTHAPYTDIASEALEDFRRKYPEEWPEFTEEELARYTRRYRRQRPRLERDFPAVVRERRWTEGDVLGIASFIEGYYKANVHVLDTWFGRLVGSIQEAGLLDHRLIAFTADHGETLYREHTIFKWAHGLQLSPDVIQVPLIIRVPGGQSLSRYSAVSRSIDVLPTLVGLSESPLKKDDPRIEGVDLTAAVLQNEAAPHLRAFSHTMALNWQRLVRFEGWLAARLFPSTDVELMWTGVRDGDVSMRRRREENGEWKTEVFDLATDPGAARDVYDPDNALHRELEADLESYKVRLVESHAVREEEHRLREELVTERLRAMGYIQ